jgi:hypothetical protein
MHGTIRAASGWINGRRNVIHLPPQSYYSTKPIPNDGGQIRRVGAIADPREIGHPVAQSPPPLISFLHDVEEKLDC